MNVCFIGHRKIESYKEIKTELYKIVECLILKGADTFIFGSKSQFNSLCYEIVSDLKQKYTHIKRVCYNATSEISFTNKETAENYSKLTSSYLKEEITFPYFEKSITSIKAQSANKLSYFARNQEMIDNSQICIFYYNKNYLPPKQKGLNGNLTQNQSKSGTALAYNYAKQKKKQIINLHQS